MNQRADNQLVKIGNDKDAPLRYGDVWQRETTTGPDRLCIGPSESTIDLMLELSAAWNASLGVLYVLLLSRSGDHEPGRYQCPAKLSRLEAEAFLARFREFLETDGRHHVWLMSTEGEGTLVYDHHGWIWAYGDLEAYTEILRQRGFREGEVRLTVPHSHHYHAVNDAAERALMSYWEWLRFPLQPDDEY